MKIGFFSEAGYQGGVPRNHPNMRNDMAWMHTLDAHHYPILTLPNIQETYDIGIITIPKTNINHYMQIDIVNELKRVCKKICYCFRLLFYSNVYTISLFSFY